MAEKLKKVKIVYTKESGRPPMYTTDKNLDNQEKFFSSIIAEVILLDDKGNELRNEAIVRPAPIVVTKTIKQEEFILPAEDSSLPEIIRNSMPPKINPSLKSTTANETPIKESITLEMVYAELIKKGKTKEEIDVFLLPKVTKVDKRFKKSKTEQKS